MFHVNGQVQGNEISVVAVERVVTQVETTYNSDDDLEETTNMLTNP